MAAFMGVDAGLVEEVCRKVIAEMGEPVACANYNAPGQTVIAGRVKAVDRVASMLRERPPTNDDGTPRRTSSIPLKVTAPFHCSLMAPAATIIADELDKIDLVDLAFPVVANLDARPNRDKGRVKELLVRQVDSAVRWQQAVRFMASEGVTHALEIGPGKVLAGLCRRIAKDMKVHSVGTLGSLDALAGFLTEA